MTIRQLLVRKALKITLSMFVLYGVIIAVVLAFGEQLGAPIVFALAALMFLATLVAIYTLFRCPSCNGNLGSLIAYFGPLRGLAKRIHHCPYCGVLLESVAP